MIMQWWVVGDEETDPLGRIRWWGEGGRGGGVLSVIYSWYRRLFCLYIVNFIRINIVVDYFKFCAKINDELVTGYQYST